VYVGFGTAISVSAKTNNISFENFSGVEDMKMESAINLTVSSSLPYKIESFITGDLTSADTEDVISTEIINIKASEAENFTAFLNAATPIVLVNNAPRGDDVPHSIDLLLKGGYMKTAGVYKTSLKFIASQL
jgi:hypothetical protein